MQMLALLPAQDDSHGPRINSSYVVVHFFSFKCGFVCMFPVVGLLLTFRITPRRSDDAYALSFSRLTSCESELRTWYISHSIRRLFGRTGKDSDFFVHRRTGTLKLVRSYNTANAMCAEGWHQSPINLGSAIGQFSAEPSTFHFSVRDISNATFENLGTNVEVIAGGSLTVNGTEYDLAQFHFHVPWVLEL